MERLSISQRIGAGFGFAILALVFVAGIAMFGTQRMERAFLDFREASIKTAVLNHYLEDVLEARAASLLFRDGGGDAAVESVNSNVEAIVNSTRADEVFGDHPELLTAINGIKDEVAQFRTIFLSTLELQARRNTLVDEFRQVGFDTRVEVSNVFDQLVAQNQTISLNAASRVTEGLILGRLYAERFLLGNDLADLETAHGHLADAMRQAAILDRLAGDLPVIGERVSAITPAIEAFDALIDETAQVILERNRINQTELDPFGTEIAEHIEVLIVGLTEAQSASASEGQATITSTGILVMLAGALAAIGALVLAIVMGRWIAGGVQKLATVTDKLAQGDLSVSIHGTEHGHELGRMASALQVFKSAQQERAASQAERERTQKETADVVHAVSAQLTELSQGNLTASIDTAFPDDFEELRSNFNSATTRLRSAFSQVVATAGEIGGNARIVGDATGQLSTRTETQAATLAETATTMNVMAENVSSTANGAKEADSYVVQTRERAAASTAVVSQAVTAMDSIKDSSDQISKIIGLIEDIAFQTNLLALNAGVEAARAGEAGQGFAVVASEVRNLAKRSSEAANEIKGLITGATENVATGVRLVGETGSSLQEIAQMVENIAALVSEISEATGDQSTGLREVNVAVAELESVTQQNAAMVEETAASAQQLADDATDLLDMTAQFRIEGSAEIVPIEYSEAS
ncbi:MAG: methyl-accepting chemotaxis protein [Pseudomonadota bacterium]